MRVLIAGGGIAGLTLAALLRQRGASARVVERRPSIGGDGYMLGLWPLGSRVLRGLGLYAAFEELSERLDRFEFAGAGGEVFHQYDAARLAAALGPIRIVPRGALVRLLAELVDDSLETGASVSRIESGEAGVRVTLDDGREDEYDLVVGCDGIHSAVRRIVFPEAAPESTGWTVMAWWLDRSVVPAGAMTEYWDAGRRFCALLPGRGRACAFAGAPTSALGDAADDPRRAPGRLSELLEDMGGAVPRALEGLRRGAADVWLDELRTLESERWSSGRVVLLGDAANAYFPFGGLGIGGSMAMESAAVLADELGRAAPAHLALALDFYERRRRPRIDAFARAAAGVVERMLCRPKAPADALEDQRKMLRFFRELLTEPI